MYCKVTWTKAIRNSEDSFPTSFDYVSYGNVRAQRQTRKLRKHVRCYSPAWQISFLSCVSVSLALSLSRLIALPHLLWSIGPTNAHARLQFPPCFLQRMFFSLSCRFCFVAGLNLMQPSAILPCQTQTGVTKVLFCSRAVAVKVAWMIWMCDFATSEISVPWWSEISP